ncbi:hypothetical protein [Rhodococcus jostii]|uniref:hypothetical protein n=1 Tax=Rhodococcus jostii TaxID=132919 RepID=UPI0036388469
MPGEGLVPGLCPDQDGYIGVAPDRRDHLRGADTARHLGCDHHNGGKIGADRQQGGGAVGAPLGPDADAVGGVDQRGGDDRVGFGEENSAVPRGGGAPVGECHDRVHPP